MLDMMQKFSIEHILSVTHDLMLVSVSELKRFLEYLCGKKLLGTHIAPANDHCAKMLIDQFPWLKNVDSLQLETVKRRLAGQIKLQSDNTEVFKAYKEFEKDWVLRVKKNLKLPDELEVKTLAQMNAKPWTSAAFTYWWMTQRQNRSFE